MKFSSFLLLLALILSAFTAYGQKTDSIFNPSTYQWEPATAPDIDSIASAILVDALTLWDYPETKYYEEFGFKKNNGTLKAKKGKTLVQIDLDIKEGKADIEIQYSNWKGNWFFSQDTNGVWEIMWKQYSKNNVPQIDDKINPLINGLHTAALKSELSWLEGSDFKGMLDSLSVIAEKKQNEEVHSIWDTEGDYFPYDTSEYAYEYSRFDTAMLDQDSVIWNISFSTDPEDPSPWEYSTDENQNTTKVYYFDLNGNCLDSRIIKITMKIEMREEETAYGKTSSVSIKGVAQIERIDCLEAPPISLELTGLMKK